MGEPLVVDEPPPGLEEFRAEVRGFLDQVHDLTSHASGESTLERGRAYLAARFDAGLGAIDYPVENGGRGLDNRYARAFRVEAARRKSDDRAPGFGIGLDMCLPTIRDHGSDDLRARFLASGLRGDDVWCQLYSEPGAGSDLAGLTTRAVRDGDEWVVTGQKVWTTGAADADYGILLARTDWDVPKHAGISMLVLPMRQPAVEVRALNQMTGVAHFNEIFMDGARIPADWVVGEEGDGWRLAMALLAHERSSIGAGGGRQPIPTDRIIDLARSTGRTTDPLVRQDLAHLVTGTRIIQWVNQRHDLHPSIAKLWRSRQGRDASHVTSGLAFPGGAAWLGDPMGATEPGDFLGADGSHWAYGICDSTAHSLGGGTDEVQKNTLGERVLGLPREPAPDRGLPFSQVPKSS
ncbi:MAG: acyl-CoA dehydrogenase family protein [Actinobacteria bacterium]|nr:acyl-CoA dehydrogenase family protein [Actinomycetota bacterium]